MLRELSLDECQSLLLRHRIGRIAMRDADGAYVVPISYAYGDGAIYGHAAPGHKLSLMRRWPHVGFQVDEIEHAARWRSVVLRCHFEELRNSDDQFRCRALLLKAFAGDHVSVTAGHGHRTTLANAVLFRLRIEEVCGRAENM